MSDDTIYDHLAKKGVSRRNFLKISGAIAGAVGLHVNPLPGSKGLPANIKRANLKATHRVAQALKTKQRLPVIWLEFQDCAGCSEALTRTHSPTLVDLVLNDITIEYHETLFAAAGAQAEANKQSAMKKYQGKYILVVEGSIPTGLNGNYCTIGGRSALDILNEAAAGAMAVVATGNCATFGGIPRANPNPTTARGVMDIIKDKPVINVPGCPAIPEAFTGTLLQVLLFGIPEMDNLHRPKAFYADTIHDRCLRRPFYEAGKFANSFDDAGAHQGFCLYKLGCKGPTTYNACATIKWDAGLSFPVQSGHPCLGCSEPNFWDGGGFYQGQSAPLDRPTLTAIGAGVAAGAVAGVAVAATNMAKKKRNNKEGKEN